MELEQSETGKTFKRKKHDGDNSRVLYRRHDCIGNYQCCRGFCLF